MIEAAGEVSLYYAPRPLDKIAGAVSTFTFAAAAAAALLRARKAGKSFQG